MILDTCALIWLAMGSDKITQGTKHLIEGAKIVFVSSISAFEISHKYAKGKLELPCDPERWFDAVLLHHNLTEIQVDAKIAITSTKLPYLHNYPCDRFIIATAKLEKLKIVTGDGKFSEYGVDTLI